ncbi:hypothetical protein [Microbacterium lushaniae]|uniref:Uncharacterized protein n=1 Tax=Microbacterium lushaniae TaxID=2614639 RepID=A0A5J6L5X3_9MICO|nr:hypothetical protein [Microbacterium lushaniae]QEW03873.1 hypothetical protein F6J85_12760 [Microbacterium lushaniae]
MSGGDRTWKSIYAAVLELLNDLDPYGLEPGRADGAPADEYSSEAGPLASHLINDGRIEAADVDAIWTRWFGEPLSIIDSARFAAFVVDLNALLTTRP